MTEAERIDYATRRDSITLFVVIAPSARGYAGEVMRIVGDGLPDKDGGYLVVDRDAVGWVPATDVLDCGTRDQLLKRAAQRAAQRGGLVAATTEPETPASPDDVRSEALRTAMLLCTPEGNPERDLRTVLTIATTIEGWLRGGGATIPRFLCAIPEPEPELEPDMDSCA